MDPAFVRAVRTTLVGSRTPALTRSSYSAGEELLLEDRGQLINSRVGQILIALAVQKT